MPDLFQTLHRAPPRIVTMIADGLEKRAKDPAQIAILESYIGDLELPDGARVIELGCGTGPVCRRFAELPAVAEVVGLDPASGLIDRAREIVGSDSKCRFEVGDGADTGLEAGSFDLVILHTLLSHVPDQQAILVEAGRLLKPGAWLAVCDADFSKTSVAISDGDPLQACVETWVAGNVTDRWLIPKLPGLLKQNGFDVKAFRGHNRVDIAGIGTGPIWIETGADTLVKRGLIGEALGEALKAESRRRIEAGQFYVSLPFATAVAVKG